MRVGVLGAWSIDNPGDVVIGMATRHVLRTRLPGAEVVAYAPRLPGPHWGHQFDAARGGDGGIVPVEVDDFAWAHRLDTLIVGGGGIVIPDERFSTFLLTDPWQGPVAAWNAVCSQGTPVGQFTPELRLRVRRCCEQLAYVSVRNRTTARFLRACGFEGDVRVVPDPAFGDISLLPAEPLPGFPIALSLGKSFLDPAAAPFYASLADALEELMHGPQRATLYLLPFGSVYGDRSAQEAVARRFPDCRVLHPKSPLEAWRAVGSMRLHITSRLHGVVAALTQNVAFLAIDEDRGVAAGSSKMRDLLSDAGLDDYGVVPTVADTVHPAIERACAVADSTGSRSGDFLELTRARLDDHWTALLDAVSTRSAGRQPRPEPS